MKSHQKIALLAATTLLAGMAHAADLPTFKLEMADGKLNPARIEVLRKYLVLTEESNHNER